MNLDPLLAMLRTQVSARIQEVRVYPLPAGQEPVAAVLVFATEPPSAPGLGRPEVARVED